MTQYIGIKASYDATVLIPRDLLTPELLNAIADGRLLILEGAFQMPKATKSVRDISFIELEAAAQDSEAA